MSDDAQIVEMIQRLVSRRDALKTERERFIVDANATVKTMDVVIAELEAIIKGPADGDNVPA